MKPEDCPKYEGCNANICPLDEQRQRRRHLPGDPVCFWLREWSKTEGRPLAQGALGEEMAKSVAIAYEEITLGPLPTGLGWWRLKQDLERASHGASKLAAGKRLRK